MIHRILGNQNQPFQGKSQGKGLNLGKNLELAEKGNKEIKSNRTPLEPTPDKVNSVNEAMIQEANQNILKEELDRVRKLYEDERTDKWNVSQERQKLQNMIKVAEV